MGISDNAQREHIFQFKMKTMTQKKTSYIAIWKSRFVIVTW